MPAGAAGAFTLALRVPGWTTAAGARVTVNGAPVAVPAAGAYLRIARAWASGDVVDAYFPARLEWTRVTDDRPQYAGWGAISYGGVLLAGANASDDGAAGADAAHLDAWVARVPDERALRFTLSKPASRCPGENASAVTLVPLAEIKDEEYVVYWRTGPPPPPVAYNGSARTVLSGVPANYATAGGASFTGSQLRSGDPGDDSSAVLQFDIDASSHAIAGVEFTYSVNAGYGPAGAPGGSNFSVALVGACGGAAPLARFYASPVIAAPAYDACATCYVTTPVAATLPAPFTFAAGPVRVAILMQDNARNLNFADRIDMTIVWA